MVELPTPVESKVGWPWQACTDVAATITDSDLPIISIITPSYNQGEFIEETIRSVLLQNYPKLEYIIIDGGSTDRTLEVIAKYSAFIKYWISEPDRGQAHAINKGLSRATGDLFAWLNSDDSYCPGALYAVSQAYRDNPGSVVTGNVIHFDQEGRWPELIGRQPGVLGGIKTFWREESQFQQPGVFVPRSLVEHVGRLDESLHFCMDLDLFFQIERHNPKVVHLDMPLAKFRWHEKSKSTVAQLVWLREQDKVWRRYRDDHDQSTVEEHDRVVGTLVMIRAMRNLRSGNWKAAWQEVKATCDLNLLSVGLIGLAQHAVRRLARRIKEVFRSFSSVDTTMKFLVARCSWLDTAQRNQWILRNLAMIFRQTSPPVLERLGTEYGGWLVPLDFIRQDWICYCAGVGEDVSFDLTLIARSGCEVFAFDPTPRAIKYVSTLSSEFKQRFHFFDYGLWSEDCLMKFYAPRNPEHVSHSVVNLQQTEEYFEGQVKRLSSIMSSLGHSRIDLLKLDVEGAQYAVLSDLLRSKIFPKVLCVEYDQPTSTWSMIWSLTVLLAAGYSLLCVDGFNLTLMRKAQSQ